MRFKGNKVDSIKVGEVMGPGSDGFYRQVTDVWFDEIDKHTYVEAEIVLMAPPGENLRYYGGADPNEPVPPTRERIEYTPRPR
ncbi:hypothetical protein [Mycolicibacterium mageritense]|uniref:hypothetical protein n=1 Tax=Mycolicibacterium mageritense TaxID=53462 RepID=UPI001E436DA7|nr:hypothetical protein [Mycolicibacterium mageritense]GJJ24103.1 hypothetical protein MTY414_77770 [Mycolicibacterium mageritense]